MQLFADPGVSAHALDELSLHSKPGEPLKGFPLRSNRNAAIGPANAGRRVTANGVKHAVLNVSFAADRLELSQGKSSIMKPEPRSDPWRFRVDLSKCPQ